MQQDIGTGIIRLTDYLPPAAVLTEYIIGAVVAFVAVQWWKAASRGKRTIPRASMAGLAAVVATAAIAAQLGVVHGYPWPKAIVYSVQGGLLAPLTITVLLWLLARFAPDLRRSLSQDRRVRSKASAEERRDDDTTRFI